MQRVLVTCDVQCARCDVLLVTCDVQRAELMTRVWRF
jgi:hypothetical protein